MPSSSRQQEDEETTMNRPRRVLFQEEAGLLNMKKSLADQLALLIDKQLEDVPEAERDSLRVELERRLQATQENMLKLVYPNILVNGYEYENFVDATEPFDEYMDRQMYAIDAERIQMDLEVAKRRQKTPSQLWRLEQDLESRRREAEYVAESVPPIPQEELHVEAPPRHEETVETFKQVVGNLSDLAAAAPGQIARATRARTVRDQVASLPA